MNSDKQLRIYADLLVSEIEHNPTFFAPIMHYAKQLQQLACKPQQQVSKIELQLIANKIDVFFARWRPDKFNLNPLYIPPQEIVISIPTINTIIGIIAELASQDEISVLQNQNPDQITKENVQSSTQCVFIGHGRSKLWIALKVFIENELKVKTVCYESESRVGESIVPVLETMLNQATFAIFVLTGEDSTNDGNKRARQNVIHEAGLFQGKLGFKKAIVLKQNGLEAFTNIDGLQYISFSNDGIEESFYSLSKVLKREGVI